MPEPTEQADLVPQKGVTAPTEGEIRAQLARILASPDFDATVKMRKFLSFVVEMTIDGRADELKGYTIGIEVYGRGPDFNPAEDTLVRIQAGRLRRALEMYYLTDGTNDPVRISIPKGTYVPVFLSASVPGPTRGEPERSLHGEAPLSDTGPSIVVLPFANLTGDPGKDYFAAGFTEEVTIELTHYEDFHVIGCRPKSGFEEKMANTEAFLRELGARFVIEGSVRMAGEQLKIGVKLTDAETQEHLWGEQYWRDLSAANLVEVQESISQEVVARIAGEYGIIPGRLTQESKRKTPRELSTYEAMLRCYYFHAVLSQEAFVDAFSSLQSAIEKEPECAMALAMLADLYFTCYSLDLPGIERPVEHGAEMIEKAVALDPMNQYVQLNSARLHFILNDRKSFLNTADRALSLNPNSGLRIGVIGFFLCLYGEWERGRALMEKTMRLNPTFPNWFYGPIVLHHYRRKDYARAYEEALKYSMPNNFWGPMLRAATLGQLSRVEDTGGDLFALQTLRPDFPERAGNLIRRYVKEEELVGQILEGLERAGLETGKG